MLKTISALVLALYATAACADGYLDGNKLFQRYQAKERMVQDSGQQLATDAIDAGFYIGYVQGATEALTGVLCIPEKLSASHAEEIVGSYLESHAGKRKMAGSLLVRQALEEAYPCRKK